MLHEQIYENEVTILKIHLPPRKLIKKSFEIAYASQRQF